MRRKQKFTIIKEIFREINSEYYDLSAKELVSQNFPLRIRESQILQFSQCETVLRKL